MATYTLNYNLPKYEADDLPNLLDEYNSAMDKIDAQLKTTDNAAAQAGTAAGNANTVAQQALTLAQTNESDISGLESSVEGINTKLSTQEQQISAHTTELADHESRITELESSETELSGQVTANTASISTKAPINHASTSGTYGLGSATDFGHVKVSDEAGTDGASQGVAASPAAIKAIVDEYLTPKVVNTENLNVVGGTITQGEFVVNIVQYGKIVAISLDCNAASGGTPIKASGAGESGYKTLKYKLPAELRPSRGLYGNPFVFLYSASSNVISTAINITAEGVINIQVQTTTAIESPFGFGGNVMFIAAGSKTL